jgi:hypothetical protein
MRRADKLFLIADEIPDGLSYQMLHDLSLRGAELRVFIRKDLSSSFHSLTQFPNVQICRISPDEKYQAQMYLETASNAYAVRWDSGQNLFSESADIGLSVLPGFTAKIRRDFNRLAEI